MRFQERLSAKTTAMEMRSLWGMTYKEIIAEMAGRGMVVTKSNLSDWLKNVEVRPEHKKRIEEKCREANSKGGKVSWASRKAALGEEQGLV